MRRSSVRRHRRAISRSTIPARSTIRPMSRRSTRIITSAAHVARVSVVQQRMVMAPMETRGGTASFDAKTGRYTLRVCSQGAGPMRDMLAAIMGIDKQKLRVRHRRCRRRLRPEERRLSGISGAACGRAKNTAARCTGWRAGRKPSTATTRRATTSRSANSRSTPTASFSRCARARSRISAPM